MTENLIFDAAASGHHGEFLENIIWSLAEGANAYVILAHPELRERLESAKLECQSAIRLEYLAEEQLEQLAYAKGLLGRGRQEIEIVLRYCESHPISRVIMMHMNVHQVALGRCALPKGVVLRGLLLNPYTPSRRAHGLRAKLFALMTGLRKRLQFAWMLRNRALERIFLLNDSAMASQLNRWHPKRAIFEAIPDPLPALSPVIEIRHDDVIQARPFCFLLAGSIAPRKGCLEALEVLSRVTEIAGRPIRLRILGRFRKECSNYRAKVLERSQHLNAQAGLCVEIEDRFISDQELGQAFAEADCILAPYLDFYGSSGMIGHACRYQKPMLVCKDGLLGELVEQRQLGLAVNPSDASSFATAIGRIIEKDYIYNSESARDYVREADARLFVARLLGDAL